MVKVKTCIFISGQGSNLKNLILSSREKNFPIKIDLVIYNNKNCKGINYAKKYFIPFKYINTKFKRSEIEILQQLKKYNISFICLAGYMKIIPNKIINNFKNKIINIHPSLLPKYKGLDTFARILKNREIKTGCTVHYVNKKLDDGAIIIRKSFFINSNESEFSLKRKTQKLEHRAYPEAVIKVFRNS